MNEQYLVNYIDNMLYSLTIDDKDIKTLQKNLKASKILNFQI